MMYILVDIGCIECGEPSRIIGIFYDIEKANEVKNECIEIQEQHWEGQHEFKIFSLELENAIIDDYYFKLKKGSDSK